MEAHTFRGSPEEVGRPQGLQAARICGVCWLPGIAMHTSLNGAGLMVGWASGLSNFYWLDSPEYLNLYFPFHSIH